MVGSSDTALAFLEALICSWSPLYHVYFTNVTVVAPHGLAYFRPPHKIRDMFFPSNSKFCFRWLHLTSLKTYVNVVLGVMTSINRRDKYITVGADSELPYDYLFLMCGTQFPRLHIKSVRDQNMRWSYTDNPKNVFYINTEVDASQSLRMLKSLICEAPKKCKFTTLENCISYATITFRYCCGVWLLNQCILLSSSAIRVRNSGSQNCVCGAVSS